MNINDITLEQIKQLQGVIAGKQDQSVGLNDMVGKKCIIRTYSAGVWFGKVTKKAGNEVIVENARRLWRFHTKKGISLSAIAIGDIDESKCRIPNAVDSVWLEAIELIPCNDLAIEILEGAKVNEVS